MAKVLVKCEGNNSPKYDRRVWQEELKSVVNVNGQAIDPHLHGNLEVKPGDSVAIWRPGKGGKRGRKWHGIVMSQSDAEGASRQPQPSSSRKRKNDSEDDDGSHSKKTEMYVCL